MGWWEQFVELLGLGDPIEEVGAIAMALRTAIVYVIALVLVRLASLRLLAKASAFDMIVAIMLGSIFSRAINGSAPLLPTLIAGVVLLVMQWLMASVAERTNWFGPMIKGAPVLLIHDGKVQKQGLRQTNFTHEDLAEVLRQEVRDEDPARVRRAHLERNGKISVFPYLPKPRVITIGIEEGTKSVRVEL